LRTRFSTSCFVGCFIGVLGDSDVEHDRFNGEDCVDDERVFEQIGVDRVCLGTFDLEVFGDFHGICSVASECDEGDESAVARASADQGEVLVHKERDRTDHGDQDDSPHEEELFEPVS
jgi:hypothetical protein